MTPLISVLFDADTEQYRLYCSAHGHTAVAGPRIFRAPPHPAIRWTHDSQGAAEADAQTLRDYLAGLPQKKMTKKAAQKNRD